MLYTLFCGALELAAGQFDRNGKAFHKISKLHSWGLLTACGIRLTVKGLENVDITKPYVYVPNHASLFDIPLIIAGFPGQIRMLYKKELERVPFFGWGLKFSNWYFPVDRRHAQKAAKSIDAVVESLKQGSSFLLFAEGTRTTDGKLQVFKRGAFNIAVRAGVPVVPVTVNGSYKILQKGSIAIHPGPVTLIFDKPIMPPATNGKESEFSLRDAVRAVIASHYIEQ